MFQGQRECDSALSWPPSSSEESVREVSERVPFAPTILSGERLFLCGDSCFLLGVRVSHGGGLSNSFRIIYFEKIRVFKAGFLNAFEYISME